MQKKTGLNLKKQRSPIWAAHVHNAPLITMKAGRSWKVFPTVELARMTKAKTLRSKLHKLCAKQGIRVPLLCFERWQCRAKLAEGICARSEEKRIAKRPSAPDLFSEPLLPCRSQMVDEGMVGDLMRAKMKEDVARCVATAMAEASSRMAADLADMRAKIVSGEELAARESKVHVCFKGGVVDLSFGAEPCKPFVRISREHYKKLSLLFQRNNGGKHDSDTDQLLQEHIFCVLVRYEALAGHGYQAALCGDGFDVLLEKLNCEAECFASPLNCRYSGFCSAFLDVDAPFGSWGSFFDKTFEPKHGSFEANPPFVPELMLAMAQKMEWLLDRSEGSLTFVVIVPAWKQVPAWRELANSKHLQAPAEVIAASSHGFCDGAQHQRRPQERFRPSSFDTAIFVLASKFEMSAQALQAVFAELKIAMASAKGDCQSIQDYENRVRQPNRPVGAPGVNVNSGDWNRKHKAAGRASELLADKTADARKSKNFLSPGGCRTESSTPKPKRLRQDTGSDHSQSKKVRFAAAELDHVPERELAPQVHTNKQVKGQPKHKKFKQTS